MRRYTAEAILHARMRNLDTKLVRKAVRVYRGVMESRKDGWALSGPLTSLFLREALLSHAP